MKSEPDVLGVFNVHVRKPIELVRFALEHFQGDCLLSLEGDLSRLDVSLIPGASRKPTDLLPRNTILPKQDFVILPVTAATIDAIDRHVLPHVGLREHVEHIQIASKGKPVFGAYDNFDPGCVWIDQAIGKDAIVSLLDSGIIKSYQARSANL